MIIDKMIMNPPYKGNLHLSILDKCISLTKEEVVNLSPIRWIKDPLATLKKSSDYYKFYHVRQHLEEVTEISAQEANESFDSIEIDFALGIYSLKPTVASDYEIQSEHAWFLKKIITKGERYLGIPTVKYSDNVKNFIPIKSINDSHKERKGISSVSYLFMRNPLNYGLYFYNGVNSNGKTLQECKDSNKRSTKGDVYNWDVVPLKTENELRNCSRYFLTDFFRFYLHCIQCNKNYPLNYILFMRDYTQPWTDERLYEFFDINAEQQNIIKETMQEFKLQEEIYKL